MEFSTSDLFDAHAATAETCSIQFRQYGGRARFAGPVRTVRTYEDNTLVRAALSQPAEGHVLVVDGGGSLRTALVGDMVAGIGVANGWSGIVIWGAVRDVDHLATLDIGIKALGSNPRPSRKQGLGQTDVELRLGDAVFRPGDWLYSDADGILVARAKLD
jgi:regulator of ribonuclease activity A